MARIPRLFKPVDRSAAAEAVPAADPEVVASDPLPTSLQPHVPAAATDEPSPLTTPPAALEEPISAHGSAPVAAAPDESAAAAESVPAEPTARARSYRERAKLRRRLRYLRQTRELAFRDLGGFVFDQYRFARNREDIVRAKVSGLEAMDRELRALEHALADRQELLVLQEPGISVCPRCGVIHGSDANFCPGCSLPRGAGAGLPLGGRPPSTQDFRPMSPAGAAHDVHVADQPTTELKTPPGAPQ